MNESGSPDSNAVLDAVELIRVELELVAPFGAAHGTESTRGVILVRAISGGHEGWGECPTLSSPGYSSEYTGAAWLALRDEIIPGLLAGMPSDMGLFPMARFGIDSAMRDLVLRKKGTSLHAELGAVRTKLPSVATVGIRQSVESLLEAVALHIDAGAVGIKLKVTPATAFEHLRAVRKCWPDVFLAADANGSWGNDSEIVPVAALDGLGLTYLEQPLSPGALNALFHLASRMETPLAIDESAKSIEATERALNLGCARVVNIKPSRLGSVTNAVELMRLCESRGVRAFVGGMLETGVGRATALAVAALDGFDLPTDLGPTSRYFLSDVTEPILATPSGLVQLPTGPGIGVTPIADKLAAVAVERVLIRA